MNQRLPSSDTPATFTADQIAHTQSSFEAYLQRRQTERPSTKDQLSQEDVVFQAQMYRWIRAALISDSQDEILEALEGIAAPISEADFDAAIANAMVKVPLGIFGVDHG
jgi:hypothetical protein